MYNYIIYNFIIKTLIVSFLCFFNCSLANTGDYSRIFPIKNYEQNVDNFLNPTSSGYDHSLIPNDIVSAKVDNYKEHLFGKSSPWSEIFVGNILSKAPPNDIKTIEKLFLNNYKKGCDTAKAIGVGKKFNAYSCGWYDKILKKMHLRQFEFPMHFSNRGRAIATDNILARAFPTNQPLFLDYKRTGQGYPFDYLQVSAIWIGSPLYVLGQSKDKLWSLVLTQSAFIAWVPTQKLALVDDNFISTYISNVNNYGLRIITRTEAEVKVEKAPYIKAYIGSIFPADISNNKVNNTRGNQADNSEVNTLMLPIRGIDGFAKLVSAHVEADSLSAFPLSPTPRNFAKIFQQLIGRPYGWGGYLFDNDCSQEMQSIFTTFGIWLPRHSSDQINMGAIEDLSTKTTNDRISRTADDGRSLVTLIYIKGHIMLYIGNYNYFGSLTPTVYNNIWGLRPADNSYRSVIGQAAFLPLLGSFLYPEDKNLISLADSEHRPIFKLSFLDRLPDMKSGEFFDLSNWDSFSENIEVRKLILPEEMQNLF